MGTKSVSLSNDETANAVIQAQAEPSLRGDLDILMQKIEKYRRVARGR